MGRPDRVHTGTVARKSESRQIYIQPLATNLHSLHKFQHPSKACQSGSRCKRYTRAYLQVPTGDTGVRSVLDIMPEVYQCTGHQPGFRRDSSRVQPIHPATLITQLPTLSLLHIGEPLERIACTRHHMECDSMW
jgi:hypothetical protein